MPGTLEERIITKFEIAANGCWNWTAARTKLGYGKISPRLLAHRAIYELSVGPISDGLELDHLCRNPSCVNPDHLEPVTHAENLRRGRGQKYELSAEWLREQYVEKGLSTIAIAKIIGCDNKTIWARLKRYGIPTRPPAGPTLTHCRRAGHLRPPELKGKHCQECYAEARLGGKRARAEL